MTRIRRPSAQTIGVLQALADDPAGWHHGYDLCRTLGLSSGTVYPILMRLAGRGQVETRWESEVPRGRPPRHLYRLSPSGRQLLADSDTEPVRRVRPGIAGAGA
jgi:PadR family transcriptional regulator, regulatory protein PadR